MVKRCDGKSKIRSKGKGRGLGTGKGKGPIGRRSKSKNISCKRLKYLIKDEKKSSKEYHGYGFHSQAKDETRHMHFLMKKYKQMGCK